VFGESIGNNVVNALMLWEDVTRFVGPSNVVVFKVYISRLRGDEWCLIEDMLSVSMIESLFCG